MVVKALRGHAERIIDIQLIKEPVGLIMDRGRQYIVQMDGDAAF